MGHVDFYPAGGSNQPGCLDIGGLINLMPGMTCSHSRAVQYFQESVHAWPGSGGWQQVFFNFDIELQNVKI